MRDNLVTGMEKAVVGASSEEEYQHLTLQSQDPECFSCKHIGFPEPLIESHRHRGYRSVHFSNSYRGCFRGCILMLIVSGNPFH